MLLDKETVLKCLDKSNKEYSAYELSLNLLPKDSVFELDVEDGVTAQYYDEANELIRQYPLSFSILKCSDVDLAVQNSVIDEELKRIDNFEEKYVSQDIDGTSHYTNIKTKIILSVVMYVLAVFVADPLFILKQVYLSLSLSLPMFVLLFKLIPSLVFLVICLIVTKPK